MSASPIGRSQSEMPARGTPPRRTSTPTGAGADQRRARREQLRNFYGINDRDRDRDGAEGEGSEQVKGDPLDIDSPSFNASMYYEHLIWKESLKGLMKTSSSLQADIGNLEGSRHSLVYNHHHQLFAAGDTISRLNSRTPQLLSIMAELQSSFSSISGLVESIALPDRADVEDENEDEDSRAKTKAATRLELMMHAGDSPETVRDTFVPLRQAFEGVQAQDGDTIKLLDQVREYIKDLPAGPSMTVEEGS